MNTILPYQIVSLVLFLSGILVVVARKNIIALMLGIELILNAAALSFVSYSRFGHINIEGHIMSLFIVVIAAVEAAVGLAIVIRFFQLRESVHIDAATDLKN